MLRNRLISLVTIAVLATTACAVPASGGPPPTTQDVPLVVRNGLPGPAHHRLDVLVGHWKVEMRTFIAGGTAAQPLVSQVQSRWRWNDKTGGRFLQEEIEGAMNGQPYYRLGILGHSNMDKRYEWVTFDRINSMMMIYRGASGDERRIDVLGEFTDQGVLGDAHIGKTVAMRTSFQLESRDRVVLDLHFTPPGEAERLVDRKTYTRLG